jgi:folate-dependent phosphoribosylglycinamide formyltransferase PurN
MRIVVLSSSLYSETACALAAHLAHSGHVPVGALALRTFHPGTILRKVGQLGVRRASRYARKKMFPPRDEDPAPLENPYLRPLLQHRDRVFHSLREVSSFHGFPVTLCQDQNAPASVEQLKAWSPDLLIFAGGNILRRQVLEVPRLGVLNPHLALLPQIRGMSAPEWSLLENIPLAVTIHSMDAGIDTGPILKRFEFAETAGCESLTDLRNRLIAFGVAKMAEVVAALDRGTISATPQSDLEKDNQFFVMHEWLQARAAGLLLKPQLPYAAGPRNE